jgi:branched-chain amino acid transport system permease protein
MPFKWFHDEQGSAVERFAKRDRLNPLELLPWVVAVAAYYLFPSYLPLGSQILLVILFAISLDLALGYAGIITLGQGAFFGVGAYTAGLYAIHVTGEPISGLLVAAVVAALFGFVSGLVVLRTTGLTLIMLTLAVLLLISEFANRARPITGGADGLSGISMKPVLGTFRFDLFGHTAYWYCLIVLFLAWVFTLMLVRSPFGRSLTGLRENTVRMHSIGAPVRRRLVTIYTISAALAGIAGALLAQTSQFVGLATLGFERSGEIVIMLVLGGIGRIYGAFVGVVIFMIAQDTIAKAYPDSWYFWVGLMLVIIVLFARGGVLGLADKAIAKLRGKRT